MKIFDRKNKYQTLVEEVELIQSNSDHTGKFHLQLSEDRADLETHLVILKTSVWENDVIFYLFA